MIPLDVEPANALPNTEAKIRILQTRVAREVQLFHPEDAKWTDEDALSSSPITPNEAFAGVALISEDPPLGLEDDSDED